MEERKITNIKNSQDIVNYIQSSTFYSKDMVYKKLEIQGEIIDIVYNESICDDKAISNFVIRSIKKLFDSKMMEDIDHKINMENTTKEGKENKEKKESFTEKIKRKTKEMSFDEKEDVKLKIQIALANLDKNITMAKTKKIDLQKEDIFFYLFGGYTCVIYQTNVFMINTRGNIERSITEPTTEKTVRGPKDAFTEGYQTNIALIRKRLKTEKLVLEEEVIGRRSKTKIGILYIEDIARKKLVDTIKKKLNKIDIDAIIDSNYIIEMIEDSNKTDFPTIISSERPDLSTFYLLQGRIALVVENSPFVIIIPAFLNDFITNIEDYFQKDINLFITKFIRYLAFIITIMTPAIYVALITFDQQSIPTQLLLSFATQREGVPFPAYLEAFMMIIAFEILREGDYRVPNTGGSTLSIVGALILGEAAVSAGIVSPIMIIVVALTTISGLMFTDISMSNALRSWRIIFLIFASVAGLVGIAIATVLLIIKLASTTSLTKPFTYPIAPINFDTIKKEILQRTNISRNTKRQKILTDNLTKCKIE